MRSLAFVLLTGCASIVLPGTADLRLKDLVVSPAAQPADFAALLAPDVEVKSGDSTVKGAAAAGAALAAIKGGPATRIMRHHDVSMIVFDSGRQLLLQRGEGDRIVRAVELRAPEASDGMPWQGIYYAKAWNTDEDRARIALLNAVWAEGGRYIDPTNDRKGPLEVSQMIGAVRLLVVGTQVNNTTGMAALGDGWFTFDWVMLTRLGGRTLFSGFDTMHVDAEGKIDFLAGFPGARRTAEP